MKITFFCIFVDFVRTTFGSLSKIIELGLVKYGKSQRVSDMMCYIYFSGLFLSNLYHLLQTNDDYISVIRSNSLMYCIIWLHCICIKIRKLNWFFFEPLSSHPTTNIFAYILLYSSLIRIFCTASFFKKCGFLRLSLYTVPSPQCETLIASRRSGSVSPHRQYYSCLFSWS